ncbi:BP74-related protein [Occultella kanbiaonis]|uniref:BP74-related protein n=1 Tax=Occultella kanbiaonis TaxID=2675754 RepID=UPI003F495C70
MRDDPGVNAPWTWHIDPASLEFADQTIEVCEACPRMSRTGSSPPRTTAPGRHASSRSTEPDASRDVHGDGVDPVAHP